MITGELRNKIDAIWDVFWAGGIANPMTVIEQFTYLLFIKGLDDRQNELDSNDALIGTVSEKIFPDDKQDLRWSHFKHLPADKMFELFTDPKSGVFAFIKNLHADKDSAFSKYMEDAIFAIPKAGMLEKIVTSIDKLDIQGKDAKGDLYEYLLSKIASAGQNGQFRTPRHIIKMMVELMKPVPTDTIIDPAAGTSGFLVAAGEYLQEEHPEIFKKKELREHYNNNMFFGFDTDTTMLRIGAMNMMLHGVENPNIEYRDSLSGDNHERERCSLILANPPFKGSLNYEDVSADILKVTKTKKTELLFVALMIQMLKKGGRCACIVPDGVLFGSSNAHKKLREEIVEKHNLRAIISMPSGVFKPYAGVSTAVMIFDKTGIGGTENIWFYDMESDGYSLDDKRTELESSDIPDIIERFGKLKKEKKRARTEKSFLVPKSEVVENEYDLSINRYKEIVYEEVEYDEPTVILDRVAGLEKDITKGIKDLQKMLSK